MSVITVAFSTVYSRLAIKSPFVFFWLQIQYFCDDDGADYPNLHNREAPNKHNRLCGHRSNWEVMRDHKDFRGEYHQSQAIIVNTGDFQWCATKSLWRSGQSLSACRHA